MFGTIINKKLLRENNKEECEKYIKCATFCNKNKDKYTIKDKGDYFEIIEYIKEEPTNDELIKQSLITEKSDLERWLKEHDYVGVKIATGRASISEYADVIAEMNIKAERINEINKILNEHT